MQDEAAGKAIEIEEDVGEGRVRSVSYISYLSSLTYSDGVRLVRQCDDFQGAKFIHSMHRLP